MDARRRFFIKFSILNYFHAPRHPLARAAAAFLRNEIADSQAQENSCGDQFVGVMVQKFIRRLGTLAGFFQCPVVKGLTFIGGRIVVFEFVFKFHTVCFHVAKSFLEPSLTMGRSPRIHHPRAFLPSFSRAFPQTHSKGSRAFPRSTPAAYSIRNCLDTAKKSRRIQKYANIL